MIVQNLRGLTFERLIFECYSETNIELDIDITDKGKRRKKNHSLAQSGPMFRPRHKTIHEERDRDLGVKIRYLPIHFQWYTLKMKPMLSKSARHLEAFFFPPLLFSPLQMTLEEGLQPPSTVLASSKQVVSEFRGFGRRSERQRSGETLTTAGEAEIVSSSLPPKPKVLQPKQKILA